ISPRRSGRSAYSVLRSEDFPEPVFPTRNTNSPLVISKSTFSRTVLWSWKILASFTFTTGSLENIASGFVRRKALCRHLLGSAGVDFLVVGQEFLETDVS